MREKVKKYRKTGEMGRERSKVHQTVKNRIKEKMKRYNIKHWTAGH